MPKFVASFIFKYNAYLINIYLQNVQPQKGMIKLMTGY